MLATERETDYSIIAKILLVKFQMSNLKTVYLAQFSTNFNEVSKSTSGYALFEIEGFGN